MIVMNGDLITKANFGQLLKFHDEHSAPATICVREYKFTVPYGVVEIDEHFLTAIEEKPAQTFFVNAGIYVLTPEAICQVPKGKVFDMPDLLKALVSQGRRPTVFPLREYWVDIGRLDDLNQARREFNGVFPTG
jgi:NDP-sugar pyrophosphorylase family protein